MLKLGIQKTTLCITRYGNVIFSRGSVIPLFERLINENKIVTATDLTMTRFMMTMDEAISLVLFAFSNGQNGEILVKKSPATTIEIIIKAISKLVNKKPKIKLIGPRHGEKYHETLLTKEELRKSKEYKDYFRIVSDNRDLNYDKYFSQGNLKNKYSQDYTSKNTVQLKLPQTIKKLKNLIGKKLFIMRIAITGANGFLGKNLFFNLILNNKDQIFKITRNTKKEIENILKNIDIIFHLAAVNRATKSKTFKNDNVKFTKYICEFLEKNKLKPLIVFSSTTQVNKNNEYGYSKRM